MASSKYMVNGQITDWAAYEEEQSALEEQNSKAVTSGQEDHTLIGSTPSKSDNDATGFLTSGKVITSQYDRSPEDDELMPALHPTDESQHSIKKILTRPVKVATITFLTSQSAGTNLYPAGFDILNLLRTDAGFRLAREKIAGFYGIHMTATLKITLNPQPFESGLFQIYFIPMKNTYGTVLQPGTAPIELTLPFTTGCPNVTCNLGIQSEVELSIPYTGPSAFINMTNPSSDFGTFYVQSIVPIRDSTNNASCELSVYLYFDNVQLFGASPRTWSLQGDCPQPPASEADAKANPLKTRGPLSSLSKPLLDVLDQMGLSAPDANPNPTRFHQDPYSSFATVDTTKTPLKTSYTFKHHLDIGQIGIDKIDESNLAYIAHKPCYYNQFSWDTTQDAGALLASYKVEPNCTLFTTLGSNTVTAPTRLRFVANCFNYWRGTLVYNFEIVANKFHSGRLRFVYSLGGLLPSNRLMELYPYAFSQIVDLRDSTNYNIALPYFASTPYRRVPHIWDNNLRSYTDPAPSNTNLVDQVAYLQVFVENELRAPDTTSRSIQIVCRQFGGPDMEFSTPITPTSFPVFNYRTENNIQVVATPAEPRLPDWDIDVSKTHPETPTPSLDVPTLPTNIPQLMGDLEEELRRKGNLPPKSSKPTPATLQGDMASTIRMVPGSVQQQIPQIKQHKYTTGEVISTVRQLIKRPQLVGAGTLQFPTGQKYADFCVYPFAFVAPDIRQCLSGDILSYFRTLYRFYRGSLRFLITTQDPSMQFTLRYDANATSTSRFVNTTASTFGSRTPIRAIVGYNNTEGNTDLADLPMSATIPYFTPLQGGMEFEIPYYSRFHKLGTSFTRNLTSYEDDIRSGLEPSGLVYFQIYSNNQLPETFAHFYRYASDDFTFGYLLGAPWCMVNVLPSN